MQPERRADQPFTKWASATGSSVSARQIPVQLHTVLNPLLIAISRHAILLPAITELTERFAALNGLAKSAGQVDRSPIRSSDTSGLAFPQLGSWTALPALSWTENKKRSSGAAWITFSGHWHYPDQVGGSGPHWAQSQPACASSPIRTLL